MFDLPRPVVAVMQPTFLPWLGYLGMVAVADVFVFLDDVQFVRRSFHHRNRLFSNGAEVDWITLPVKDTGRETCLNEAHLACDRTFARKFAARLRVNYGQTPHYDAFLPLLTAWLDRAEELTLAECNAGLIEAISGALGLGPQWCRSSTLGVSQTRSERIAAILRATGAGSYLSAEGSFAYMQEDDVFPLEGIATAFHRFETLAYPQMQSLRFVEKLSVADALFQVGAEGTRALVLDGLRAPVRWEERPCV
ncbi:MAG: WbqC family protein [Proteobacteria bacterium]|nr:WbqC family protein [Pseudomonadota bacterium]MDA0952781.1 WbqC family protein [Pseudomonadota bacterium]